MAYSIDSEGMITEKSKKKMVLPSHLHKLFTPGILSVLSIAAILIIIRIFLPQPPQSSSNFIYKHQLGNLIPTTSQDNPNWLIDILLKITPGTNRKIDTDAINPQSPLVTGAHVENADKKNSLSVTGSGNVQNQDSQNSTSNSSKQGGMSSSDGLVNTSHSQTSVNSNNGNSVNLTPTPVTSVQIIFQDPNGQTQVYTPPSTPPVQVTWAVYDNPQDRYMIQYPSNWQMIKNVSNNHEGIAVFPPGYDINSPDTPHIGLGVAANYTMPQVNNNPPYVVPIVVDGVNGTLYTQGALGQSYIASIFPRFNGSFGIASNVSTLDITYIYNYMLTSIIFY